MKSPYICPNYNMSGSKKKRECGHKFQSWKTHGNNLCHNIFWCEYCNVPIIDSICDICNNKGAILKLSPPGDIRFCSPVEREILNDLLLKAFQCNPIEERIILLNKISGEDRTDEIIVDGLLFGILRFDMKLMDYVFDLSIQGAKILLNSTSCKTVELRKASSHLNGKKIKLSQILNITNDISTGDTILIQSHNLTGFGIYCAGQNVSNDDVVLRVRKIDSTHVSFNNHISTINDAIKANSKHINKIAIDAVNQIKGIAQRKEYVSSPINVAFSGGKDSLVVLNLTLSAVKKERVKAFFLNTGIEYPETLDFVQKYCKDNNIYLRQISAEGKFWDNVEAFGPPAKDMRWCCKVCKLGPANIIVSESAKKNEIFLTIDGKRKYESFSRASIGASETNPFVPNQVNIFPIRNWRAIEVWLYIYKKTLSYNPLYNLGFERVGCYLCPASLSAEYKLFSTLHPQLYNTWNKFLQSWAKQHGLSELYIKHGLWRWKSLPSKMIKLAENIGINYNPKELRQDFKVTSIGGVSPCKNGDFSIEASITGISFKGASNILNILGNVKVLEDMGVLIVQNTVGSINFFSSNNLVVTSNNKENAVKIFDNVVLQFMRQSKCSGCGICKTSCPVHAIDIYKKELLIKDNCIHCGKCNNSCVIIKYAPKFFIN